MKFKMFGPNSPVNSQSWNSTQVTNSYYNLSHWFLHNVLECEKRKNMTEALVRNELNASCFECFWKSN